MLTLAGALSVAAGAQTFVNDETYTVGNVDASSDKAVNALDVYAIRSYVVGKSVNIDKQAADLNADRKVDAVDVYNLRFLIVGQRNVSDFDNGKQLYKFTIADTDISQYTLYIPADAVENENVTYSAELLQKYTKEACGTELKIVKGTPASGEHAIIFNRIARKSELGQQLGSDGYMYDVTNGVMNIYGTYRGNMYAVYEIIEKYLGYRFYDDFYTFLYKQRTVDIPEGTDRSFQPLFKFRFARQNVAYGGENYYFPARQNGAEIIGYEDARYGYKYGPNGYNAHSYAYYWMYATGTMPEDDGSMTLDQRYQAKYDSCEFKDYLKWQPCATDESVYKTLFEGLLIHASRMENWKKDFYDFNGAAKEQVEVGEKSLSFSINDNETYCDCLPCDRKAKGRTRPNGEVIIPKEGYGALYLDMANKAAVDIQEYYPGMRIHTILYNHDIPATIKPDKNVIIFFCGQGCNNHYISEECTSFGQIVNVSGKKENNKMTAESLKAWGALCAETGAEMWYWYYGVTYFYYLISLPCVFNIYYDYKFLYEECNVKGIYYEGMNNIGYNFENLKAYLSTRMDWEPDMSYEQYIAYLKEFLYMYYGEGYELIYDFIVMENTAGDECGTCFISNFDRPGDMYSYAYIDEHYEEMRQLLLDALDATDKDMYKRRINILLICFDFLGLSSSYDRMYTNGDAASRKLYEQRYTDMYNGIKNYGIQIYYMPSVYDLPDTIDFTVNPMTQFYKFGSYRPGVTP